MECKQIQAMLTPYLEGLVSPDEKQLVEQHLASCTQCTDAIEDLKKTAGLLRNLEEVEPPPWFTQKVMARVREEAEKKNVGVLERLFFPLRVKVPIQALATAMIVVLALYVFRSVEPEMKLAQAPPETAQVITTEEAREQHDRAGGAAAPETKAAPEEKRLKDTEGPVVAPRADSIGTLKKEEPGPAPGIEVERAKQRKSEAVVDRAEPEMRAAAPSQVRQEAAQPQKPFAPSPAPAGAPESAGSAPSASTRSRDTREEKALAPARDTRSFAAKEAAPITFAVRVGDVEAAARDIQNLLVRLGARSTTAESHEDKTLIAADLPARALDELLRKLNSLGQVSEKGSRPAVPDGTVPIRIEVSVRP